jgi:hypothetical protein
MSVHGYNALQSYSLLTTIPFLPHITPASSFPNSPFNKSMFYVYIYIHTYGRKHANLSSWLWLISLNMIISVCTVLWTGSPCLLYFLKFFSLSPLFKHYQVGFIMIYMHILDPLYYTSTFTFPKNMWYLAFQFSLSCKMWSLLPSIFLKTT